MFKPKFTISNKINKALTQIERSRGFLDAARLTEDWLAFMQKKALILEAHHTTHIEGTHLSLEQSKKLLEGKKVSKVNPDDKQELLNYKTAFEFVSTYLQEKKPITEGLVRQIHSILVQNVRGNSAMPGEYRKVQNFVVNSKTHEIIYTPPPAYDVPIMMKELVEWLENEKEIHPILISGIIQFQFVHIHPFLDGNGRTARLLSTLYLYKTGYDFKRLFTISEYYDRERQKYYLAIQSVRENNLDMTKWLEYFCLGLTTQLKELQHSTESKIKLDLFCNEKKLSENQKKALELALEGPFTLQDFMDVCPTISKRTLQRELSRLQELDMIESFGATAKRTYHLKDFVNEQ
ncbi:MAG: Adenosine monophosphate-protein transferase SoFic [Candidatus Anoxychlamydiales bacterium]|nr:Adenosine monophosphate-protein transferase SoFic [Candidatus Anoxychlamydiales bacterium]